MKLVNYFLICSLIFLLPTSGHGQTGSAATKKIKIACVGNSITYGAEVANRDKNAYPAQLQAMLGDHYQVENFGVTSRTLLKKGYLPYWKSEH